MVSFPSSLKRFKNFPISFSSYFNSPKRMIVIKNTNVICRFNLICINREEVTYFLKIFVIVFKFQKLGSRKFVERARGALRERVSKIELAERARLILGARHVLRNFLTLRALTKYFMVIPSLKTQFILSSYHQINASRRVLAHHGACG